MVFPVKYSATQGFHSLPTANVHMHFTVLVTVKLHAQCSQYIQFQDVTHCSAPQIS